MAKVYTWPEKVGKWHRERHCLEVSGYEFSLIRKALKMYEETAIEFEDEYGAINLIEDTMENFEFVDRNPIVTDESRATGKWKRYCGDIWTCFACGENLMCDDIECNNYCPNCGARME